LVSNIPRWAAQRQAILLPTNKSSAVWLIHCSFIGATAGFFGTQVGSAAEALAKGTLRNEEQFRSC
jgi:hypothetical protein